MDSRLWGSRTIGGGLLFAILAAMTIRVTPVSAQGAPAPGDSVELRVDGMVCSLCAYGVERRLRAIEGVEGVRVDLKRQLVVVTVRPGVTVADSVLNREVTRAGFTLRAITRRARVRVPGGPQE